MAALVETRTDTDLYGYPPPPPPSVYTANILTVLYDPGCLFYGPTNTTIYDYANHSLLKFIYNSTWLTDNPPNSQYHVYKSGRTTGYTRSYIAKNWASWGYGWVAYRFDNSSYIYYGLPLNQSIADQVCWWPTNFSEPGDSGSPVYAYLNDNGTIHTYAIGLISGSNNDIVVVVPLDLVFWDYKLLTGEDLHLYRGPG